MKPYVRRMSIVAWLSTIMMQPKRPNLRLSILFNFYQQWIDKRETNCLRRNAVKSHNFYPSQSASACGIKFLVACAVRFRNKTFTTSTRWLRINGHFCFDQLPVINERRLRNKITVRKMSIVVISRLNGRNNRHCCSAEGAATACKSARSRRYILKRALHVWCPLPFQRRAAPHVFPLANLFTPV